MFTSAVWLINLSTTHNIPLSNTDYLLVRLDKCGELQEAELTSICSDTDTGIVQMRACYTILLVIARV